MKLVKQPKALLNTIVIRDISEKCFVIEDSSRHSKELLKLVYAGKWNGTERAWMYHMYRKEAILGDLMKRGDVKVIVQ